MPNHVEQDLWVSGYTTDIREFVEFAKEQEGDQELLLSANKFIPYPKEYLELDKKAKEEYAKGNYSFVDGFNSGGYNWCKENWGTKWGIYECTCRFPKKYGEKKKATVFYTFQSAWSPATKIVFAMSQKFLTLSFKLKYYERGMQFKGLYIVKNGVVETNTTSTYKGSRGG